jgi:Raf kinase inhibitor-like YbhB/YbcL family protein
MKRAIALPVSLVVLMAVVLVACGPGGAPEPTAVPEQPTTLPSTPTVPAPTPTSPGEPAAEAASPTASQAPPEEEEAAPTPTPAPPLEISSSAFEPGGEIPVQYSCHGANLSPPLEWAGVPEGTQSLALMVDDPDSEPPGFVHWVIYNISATATGLPEGVAPDPSLSDGALQGKNDFAQYPAGTFPGGSAMNQVGYDGPWRLWRDTFWARRNWQEFSPRRSDAGRLDFVLQLDPEKEAVSLGLLLLDQKRLHHLVCLNLTGKT